MSYQATINDKSTKNSLAASGYTAFEHEALEQSSNRGAFLVKEKIRGSKNEWKNGA